MPSDAIVTHITAGTFSSPMPVHRALDDLHDAGFSDAQFAVIGPEAEDTTMQHSDSTMDNMVEDGAKLRRWGETPDEWHFENADEGITLLTAYQNEGVAGLRDALIDMGLDEDQAAYHANGVAAGGTLVLVHNIEGDEVDRAKGILIKHGASTEQ